MELGFIGLGKMGANMVRRLLPAGHVVHIYGRKPEITGELAKMGAKVLPDISEFGNALKAPRVIWMMIPAGDPVDEMIETLLPQLSAGDILVDGGNSRYRDTVRRAEKLKGAGIHYVDSGTSGGIWGLKVGYCLMVGGEKKAFQIIEPALKTLAPPDGYLHVGGSGAGHYVKMIHNGIEYGMMQAYAEGMEIMKESQFQFDLPAICKLWNQGSVVRSWLLELLASALAEDPKLDKLQAYVQDSGEGRWTVNEAVDLAVPAPVLTTALFARFRSRRENSFADRCLSALRNQFGGHAVKERK